MLPEFETAAHGLTKGETKTFELTFPCRLFRQGCRGQDPKFVLTAKEVSAPVLPRLTQSLPKHLAFPVASVDALKAEVRGNLELERKRRVFQSVRDQVFRGLRTQATLEIPKALVAAEADRMVQAAGEEMKSRAWRQGS